MGHLRWLAIQVASVRDPAEVSAEWRLLAGHYQVIAILELKVPTTVIGPRNSTCSASPPGGSYDSRGAGWVGDFAGQGLLHDSRALMLDLACPERG